MRRLKETMALVTAVSAILIGGATSAQEWHWICDHRMFNPSGLSLDCFAAQFRVVDWNEDQKWDFVINQGGRLELFLNTSDSLAWTWKKADIEFPDLKPAYDYWGISAFCIIDFDGDGDSDLVADSLKFWRNQGSNDHPSWVSEPSFLSGIGGHRFDPFWVDVDNDGDWDLLTDGGDGMPVLAINEGDNFQPVWKVDSLFFRDVPTWSFEPSLTDYDQDGDKDLFIVSMVPADPITCYEPILYENVGTDLQPQWQETMELKGLYWCLIRPSYEAIDFNQDGQVDFLMTDSEGHLAFYLNRGSPDSLDIDPEAPFLVGNICGVSGGIPFLYDYQADGDLDLIISEEIIWSFVFVIYYEGSVASFAATDHTFDLNNPENDWFPNPLPLGIANFARNFYLNFGDFDRDGDLDYVFSYYNTNLKEEIMGSRCLLYRNQGNNKNPNWVAEPDAFVRFDSSDSLFYAPCLVDIDGDGDLDVFIKRKDAYTFYENAGDSSLSIWKENPTLLTGLDELHQRLAVFADLDCDRLLDLVFEGMDGTLRLYLNVGTMTSPAWQHDPNAFSDIDVEFGAPTFGDMDGDGDLDLIIDRGGRLSYFRNESKVGIEEPAVGGQKPESFLLHQNHPNPFSAGSGSAYGRNTSTTIRYDLPQPTFVTLEIYNLLGQKVRTLVAENKQAGCYQTRWDGLDGLGKQLPSGIYFYRIQAGHRLETRKAILMQ